MRGPAGRYPSEEHNAIAKFSKLAQKRVGTCEGAIHQSEEYLNLGLWWKFQRSVGTARLGVAIFTMIYAC